MNAFLGTLAFLTIIPVYRASKADDIRVNVRMEYFPAVGFLIGLIVAAADMIFARLLPPVLAGACTIIFLAVLTGGLHLDGLADTADGFFSARPREEIFRIMRDSRSGSMAIAAVASILILKVAAAASLAPDIRTRAIILMPFAGRCAMSILMGYMPCARSDGLAALLQPKQRSYFAFWPLIGLLLVGWLLWGISGVMQGLVSLLAVAPLALLMWRKIGGITGDTLGAACEVVETVSIITAAGIGFSMGN
jgi:adenosylcobinamide-GDP ribazoletransferase